MRHRENENTKWFFGASYSRSKFWVVTLMTLVFIGVPTSMINQVNEAQGGGAEGILLVLSLCLSGILMNTLANRIRDYGGNPWLSLWSILPLVGLIQALYFGMRLKKKSVAVVSDRRYKSTEDINPSAEHVQKAPLRPYEPDSNFDQKEAGYSHGQRTSRSLKRLE